MISTQLGSMGSEEQSVMVFDFVRTVMRALLPG
jgi:hypothetical protein